MTTRQYNQKQEKQKAFEYLLKDITNIKNQVDSVYLKLKRIQNHRLRNQDVLDFLDSHEAKKRED